MNVKGGSPYWKAEPQIFARQTRDRKVEKKVLECEREAAPG